MGQYSIILSQKENLMEAGTHHTDETRAYLSQVMIGKEAWNRGMKMSSEFADNVGEGHYKGREFRKHIILDPEFEYLRELRWAMHKGYPSRRLEGGKGRIYLHHSILPVKEHHHVDHINGNKLDNRSENLRYATFAQNQQNRKLQKNNKSGYKGVIWSKHANKWQAYIRVDKKLKHLGYFSDILEAAQAYKTASDKHFGSYART